LFSLPKSSFGEHKVLNETEIVEILQAMDAKRHITSHACERVYLWIWVDIRQGRAGCDSASTEDGRQKIIASQKNQHIASHATPCGKQHFREIPTPDFVRTLRPYPILNSMLDSYIYLQNPAWVFRGNVVSHMDTDRLR
jgi:hypothetical protein